MHAIRQGNDSCSSPDTVSDSFVHSVQCKDLEYTTIANGHGPLLRYNMRGLVDDYGKWSAAVEKSPTSVAVLYSDNYGYCDRLSQTMAKGITKAGVRTDMVDLVRF